MKRRLNTKTMSARTNDILRREGLVTVCEEAPAPIAMVLFKNVATFMLMGDTCTRPAPSATLKLAKKASCQPLIPPNPNALREPWAILDWTSLSNLG